MPSCHVVFKFSTFLSISLGEKRGCLFALGSSSSPFNSFCMWLIYSTLVLCSLFPYFDPKWFCFLVVRLLVCLHAFSPYLLVEIFFIAFECPVFLGVYCFTLSRYIFGLLSFARTFRLISFCSIFCFTCCVIIFLFVPACSSHLPLSYHFCILSFPVEFLNQVLCFCSYSLEGHGFYDRLFLFLHRLVRLIH